MTMHTKAATDEIYELFNQPIVKPAVREEEESDNDLYYETDGDYTSGAESTGTTRQVSTSEAGDDEPPEADEETSDVKSVSEWSDFTARKHVPQIQALLKKAEPQEAQEAEELDLIDINEVPSAEHTTDHSTETGTGTGPTMYHTADQTRSPGDSVEEAEHVIQTPEEEAEEAEDAGDADVDDVEEALVTPTEEEFSPPRTRSIFIPVMPEDYNPPTRRWRDPEDAANCRLPFMTPITERTESSLEMATEFQHRALEAKTPCKTDNQGTPTAASSSFEQFSSPLRDIVNEARSPPKLPMPRLQKLTKPAVAKPAATRPPARKGPIIKDLQCNPVDESIRAEILANIQPSLSSYSGFFDHRNEDYEHGGEIRRYIKSLAKAGKGGDRTANMTAAPVIQFVDTPTQYTVRKELGEGAFAPVYLVENSTAAAEEKADDVDQQQNGAVVPVMGRGAFGTAAGRRRRLEALKMEDPPSAWEFHMMRLVHSRLGPHERATRSIAVGLELHLYRDEGFLLMPFRPHGTLLDVVNQFRGEGTGMDELLVMFFTIELLRTIEAMHAKQLMHGDLKPDNCMLRLDDDDDGHVADKDGDGEDDLSPRYRADGSGGWSRRGLTLIDLGRGIDMRVFRPDVGFVADWKTCAQDCAEMREGRPWTWHVDYHGVASIVHCMLFGRYIETVRCTGPAFTSTSTTAASSFGDVSGLGGGLGNAAGRRYRIREPLKRYWQADLWGDLFEMMLNPAAAAASVPHPDSPNETAEEGGKMPLVRSMRRIRERMESWLEENCERGVGLRGLVMRLEAWARARRR